MASLCNYTHPELQNISGLERQGHGVLFPYNPEFYARASGLYGPGTIIAWNMLFISLFINAVYQEYPDYPQHRHNFWSGMSGELVTFVAYPMFAATDLLVHGAQLIGHENRALVLRCLRDPSENFFDQGGDGIEYPQHRLDLANIPPDILSLGQRVVEITGPLDVTYVSFFPLAFWTIVTLAEQPPNGVAAATIFTGVGTIYVMLLSFIFHCTLGSFSIGIFFIPILETVRLIWRGLGVVLIVVDVIAAGGVMLFSGYWLWIGCLWLRGDRGRAAASAPVGQDGKPEESPWYSIPGIVIIGLFIWVLNTQWFDTLRPTSPWVPDLGIAISEQDQLAALIAASLSLAYTVYCAVRKIRMEPGTEVGDTVELQNSLLPGREAHDVEAPSLSEGARRVSTM